MPNLFPRIRRSATSIIVGIVLVLCSVPAIGATQEPLGIAVGETSVTVSNNTTGGSIVLFSCSRAMWHGRMHVSPRATILQDDDKNGAIEYVVEGGVPLRSVWIAIDSSTGAMAAGSLPEFPLSLREIASEGLRKSESGEFEQLLKDLPELELLILRPGSGAWRIRAQDGKEGSDRDGVSNGKLVLSFEDAESLTDRSKGPKHLRKDDVLVAIDPGRLNVFVARIAN